VISVLLLLISLFQDFIPNSDIIVPNSDITVPNSDFTVSNIDITITKTDITVTNTDITVDNIDIFNNNTDISGGSNTYITVLIVISQLGTLISEIVTVLLLLGTSLLKNILNFSKFFC